MVGILILFVSILMVLADLIVVCTSDKLYAGKFIRKLRYFVYSITPARYILIMIVFGIIGKLSDFSSEDIRLLEMLLLSGLIVTYSEKSVTCCKSQKRRISARRLKPLKQKKG